MSGRIPTEVSLSVKRGNFCVSFTKKFFIEDVLPIIVPQWLYLPNWCYFLVWYLIFLLPTVQSDCGKYRTCKDCTSDNCAFFVTTDTIACKEKRWLPEEKTERIKAKIGRNSMCRFAPVQKINYSPENTNNFKAHGIGNRMKKDTAYDRKTGPSTLMSTSLIAPKFNQQTKTTTVHTRTTEGPRHVPTVPPKTTAAPSQSPTPPTKTTADPSQSPTTPTKTTAAPSQSPTPPTKTTAAPSQPPTVPIITTAAPSHSPTPPTLTTAAPSQSPTPPTKTTAAPSQPPTVPIITTAAPSHSPTPPTLTTASPSHSPIVPTKTIANPSVFPMVHTKTTTTAGSDVAVAETAATTPSPPLSHLPTIPIEITTSLPKYRPTVPTVAATYFSKIEANYLEKKVPGFFYTDDEETFKESLRENECQQYLLIRRMRHIRRQKHWTKLSYERAYENCMSLFK